MILSAPKDDLIYHYAVARCRQSQFNAMDQDDIVAFRKKEYQIDVLVNNKTKMERKYQNLVMDTASIDEMMLLMIKGERV